ncbi:hypothetical protein EAX62_09570 [Tessaracoccus antarcticus]|uniref:Glutaredoxin domain-containing protein n=2 Tax=Tessaracoccus antarcticus TaxID=2479848 RepID=A0A3M0G549_9ACTN|nr:hypothetical protein EAX62_09570 [Tessaracoccus antarcticus]
MSKLVVIVALFVAIIAILARGTSLWWVAALTVVGAGLVAFTFRRGRHTPWATARGHVASGHAVVFWKPGCVFCERLLLAMGKDDRITWVNVWADKDANAEVRRLNGGDELTPTALVGERVLRNPSAQDMIEYLSAGQRP